MDDRNVQTIKLASWLAGVCWSFELRGYPNWVSKEDLKEHYRIAMQCLGKGAFNPLQVYDMEDYTQALMVEAKVRLASK